LHKAALKIGVLAPRRVARFIRSPIVCSLSGSAILDVDQH
jgi:hypothetical protein